MTHEGKVHKVALAGAASGFEPSFAAFYADCEHQVKPIREGYRLYLVYSLSVAGYHRLVSESMRNLRVRSSKSETPASRRIKDQSPGQALMACGAAELA